MQFWYAYTGRNLIIGRGRTIRHVVADFSAWQDIVDVANAVSAPAGVEQKTFTAALAAATAARELADEAKKVTVFASQQQVFLLFDDIHIEQAALNIINGRVASAYTENDITARVEEGFYSGELWQLPRDADRLREATTFADLPGVVATLLAREQAERKSFANYLRRGAAPIVSKTMLDVIARSRPVLSTWTRHARLRNERAKL